MSNLKYYGIVPMRYMPKTGKFNYTEAYDHCHSSNEYDDVDYCTNNFLNEIELKKYFEENCEG